MVIVLGWICDVLVCLYCLRLHVCLVSLIISVYVLYMFGIWLVLFGIVVWVLVCFAGVFGYLLCFRLL